MLSPKQNLRIVQGAKRPQCSPDFMIKTEANNLNGFAHSQLLIKVIISIIEKTDVYWIKMS